MVSLFVAAMREWKRSVEGNIRALGGIQLRVEKVMDVTISREMEQLDRRLLFLATVGSTAPFIGLFGTVIGIMHAFDSIGEGGAGFAAVSQGISEALATTALGILVAIPAAWMFNYLTHRVEGLSVEMTSSSSELVDFFRELRSQGAD